MELFVMTLAHILPIMATLPAPVRGALKRPNPCPAPPCGPGNPAGAAGGREGPGHLLRCGSLSRAGAAWGVCVQATGLFKLHFLRIDTTPSCVGGPIKMSNTSWLPVLPRPGSGKVLTGWAYSSRQAMRPEVPVAARPGRWRCGRRSRLYRPRWRRCRRRSTYTARSTWRSATPSAKCPSGSAPRRGRGGAGSRAVRPGRGGSRRPARRWERRKRGERAAPAGGVWA